MKDIFEEFNGFVLYYEQWKYYPLIWFVPYGYSSCRDDNGKRIEYTSKYDAHTAFERYVNRWENYLQTPVLV